MLYKHDLISPRGGEEPPKRSLYYSFLYRLERAVSAFECRRRGWLAAAPFSSGGEGASGWPARPSAIRAARPTLTHLISSPKSIDMHRPGGSEKSSDKSKNSQIMPGHRYSNLGLGQGPGLRPLAGHLPGPAQPGWDNRACRIYKQGRKRAEAEKAGCWLPCARSRAGRNCCQSKAPCYT